MLSDNEWKHSLLVLARGSKGLARVAPTARGLRGHDGCRKGRLPGPARLGVQLVGSSGRAGVRVVGFAGGTLDQRSLSRSSAYGDSAGVLVTLQTNEEGTTKGPCRRRRGAARAHLTCSQETEVLIIVIVL